MCLNPITIYPKSVGLYRQLQGRYKPIPIQVPCGHCLECLGRKQNDLATRLFEEAKDKKHMYFVTLTYAPEFEPWAISYWNIDRDSGCYYRVADSQVLEDTHFLVPKARKFSNTIHCDLVSPVRVFEFPICLPDGVGFLPPEDKTEFVSNNIGTDGLVFKKPSLIREYRKPLNWQGCDFVARLTPSVDMRHPRLALKRWRVNYKRTYGLDLPDFRYALVGEYGRNYTKRPHYHLCFISDELQKWQLEEFLKEWTYGRSQLDVVPRFNKDGSDAYSFVSRYLGKYISKGVFDNPAVNFRMAKNGRLCTSKGLGKNLTQVQIDSYTCQDMKRFDIENPDKYLTEEDKKVIIPEIARRLTYELKLKTTKNCKRSLFFRLPDCLIKQIFNFYVEKNNKEAHYAPLYYMVKDCLQSQYTDNYWREFKRFQASRPPSEEIACTVAAFSKMQERALQDRKKVAYERLQHYYNTHSKI